MRMKRLIVMSVFITFFLNISNTAYGAELRPMSKYSKRVVKLLKEKLDISDIEIENARVEGKTAFDLAKTKGMEEEELRQCITLEATKAIDGLSSKGIMPRFLTNIIKSLAGAKIATWDGKL